MSTYNERKTYEQKLWQAQADASAWIQGQYIRAAIDSMFPKGQRYPGKPLETFSSEEKPLSADNDKPQISESERTIRERSRQIDEMLSAQNKPQVIVGEKRI